MVALRAIKGSRTERRACVYYLCDRERCVCCQSWTNYLSYVLLHAAETLYLFCSCKISLNLLKDLVYPSLSMFDTKAFSVRRVAHASVKTAPQCICWFTDRCKFLYLYIYTEKNIRNHQNRSCICAMDLLRGTAPPALLLICDLLSISNDTSVAHVGPCHSQ